MRPPTTTTVAPTGLAARAADLIENVFGQDPGRLRLVMAGRSVVSCALALVTLLVLEAYVAMPVAGIGLGFMVSIFGSMMVGDATKKGQALSFLLLALPPLPAIALAALLAPWHWAIDLGFVALAVAVILARQAGSRGMGMGMTAYIAYLMGAILHPKLEQLPLVLLAVPVGVLSSALVRFLVLPDRPLPALKRAVRDVQRRIPRVLDALCRDLDGDPDARRAPETRLHRELALLNDAVLIAQQQLDALPEQEKGALRPVGEALFELDLAAERTIRVIAFPPPPRAARPAVVRRLASLRARLAGDIPPEQAEPLPPGCERIGAVLDGLESRIRALQQAIAAVRSGRGAQPAPHREQARHAA